MKGKILEIISIIIIAYSLVVNIFFAPQNTENNYQKSETVSLFPNLKSAFSSEVIKHSNREEIAGLGLGYLVGEKDEIPDSVEKKMKIVGLTHLIVVSGTHLSIIISAVRKLTEKISRFSALYFSIFCLILYIGLVGLSPSLLRASFVAIFSLFAWFFGRKIKPERTVLLTLGFCLLIIPYLLTNLSFQLSILAYSGIVVLFPRFQRFFYGRKKPSFLGKTILSSLSAQLTCFPLQLYFFGTFNFLSILANLLILPTIPFSMILSFFTGLFGFIHLDFLADIFGFLSIKILNYHNLVINFISDRPEFLIEVSKKNLLFLLLYFILIFSVILIFRNQKKKRKEKFQKLKNLKSLNLWE